MIVRSNVAVFSWYVTVTVLTPALEESKPERAYASAAKSSSEPLFITALTCKPAASNSSSW